MAPAQGYHHPYGAGPYAYGTLGASASVPAYAYSHQTPQHQPAPSPQHYQFQQHAQHHPYQQYPEQHYSEPAQAMEPHGLSQATIITEPQSSSTEAFDNGPPSIASDTPLYSGNLDAPLYSMAGDAPLYPSAGAQAPSWADLPPPSAPASTDSPTFSAASAPGGNESSIADTTPAASRDEEEEEGALRDRLGRIPTIGNSETMNLSKELHMALMNCEYFKEL